MTEKRGRMEARRRRRKKEDEDKKGRRQSGDEWKEEGRERHI